MESAVAERSFRAGQLHISDLPASRLAAYASPANPSLRLAPQINTVFLVFNVERPPFKDTRVRRALSLGLRRADLVNGALAGRATPAHSLTWPGTGGYTAPKMFREDREEARRLLAAAGFADGAGLPPVDLMLGGTDPVEVKAAEVIQEAWRKNLGVTATLSTPEWSVFRDHRRTGNYQVALMSWPHWFNDPTDILEIGLAQMPVNYSRWSHATFDRRYRQAEQARTDAERYAAFDAIEALLAEEVPYLPLYHPFKAQLVHPAVRSWRDNPLGFVDWRTLSLQAGPGT
jgi:oligopeptide transport system substrate-binding protein